MTNRADRLRSYIAAAKNTVVGVDDCGPWVARWIARECDRPVCFPDYQTREEGYEIMRAAGGLTRLAQTMVAAIPLWETTSPVLGDVGIVMLRGRETAAILCGNGVTAIRGEKLGVIYFQPRGPALIKAWALPSA